jgi:hypothetical protein
VNNFQVCHVSGTFLKRWEIILGNTKKTGITKLTTHITETKPKKDNIKKYKKNIAT